MTVTAVARPAQRVEARWLEWAATFFAAAVLFHNSDHVRRGGQSVTTDVFWVGSAAIVLEVGVVVLAFMHHREAPMAALAVGTSLAVGYLFVHFTPERSWLSDSFPDGDVSAVSWVAASLEATAAAVLAVAGAVALRRGGELVAVPLTRALRHPVVVAMAGGNVVIFLLATIDRYG